MARNTTTIVTDDLDGTDATETVTFGIDGAEYEIDLNGDNAQALRAALSTYVAKGRKTAGRKRAAAKPRKGTGEAAKIRAWAVEQGIDIAPRGRISAELRARYEAEQGAPAVKAAEPAAEETVELAAV